MLQGGGVPRVLSTQLGRGLLPGLTAAAGVAQVQVAQVVELTNDAEGYDAACGQHFGRNAHEHVTTFACCEQAFMYFFRGVISIAYRYGPLLASAPLGGINSCPNQGWLSHVQRLLASPMWTPRPPAGQPLHPRTDKDAAAWVLLMLQLQPNQPRARR